MNHTEEKNKNPRHLYKQYFAVPGIVLIFSIAISIFLLWMAIFQLKSILLEMGVMDSGMAWSARFKYIYIFGVIATFFLIGLPALYNLLNPIKKFWARLSEKRWFKGFWFSLFLIIILGLIYLFYKPFYYLGDGTYIQMLFLWVLFWVSWAMFIVFKNFREEALYQKVLLNALLVGFSITLANSLSLINNHPLSASWSEGSILYYASTFFSDKIYGIQLGLPVINPGRALMQSIPFAFSGVPIAVHRIWDAILWIVLPLAVGYALVKRLKISDPLKALIVVLFSLLFLNLSPIYYHLLFGALIVLLGFRHDRFWLSIVVVVLASLWAGLTRINWYPVPGSLAAILYWLETPGKKNLVKDTWKPAVWFTVGFLVSILSFQLYVELSGTTAAYFENPFDTPLLWYRLFPSATNPTGLLPGILLATLPALLFVSIVFFLSKAYTWVRRASIFVLLMAFLLGGFIVSVRIGGGNNLHNFDAYFLLLLILIEYSLFGKIVVDNPGAPSISHKYQIAFVILLLVLPIYNPVSKISSATGRNMEANYQEFQHRVEQDVLAGKSVLLVDNPHLIAFDFWDVPPQPPEYEKVFLMEAAMTGNQAFLENYYAAIAAQKYDYILTERLSTLIQGSTRSFGEENDSWVKAISEPTLCYYEVVYSFADLGLDYLAPRETVCETGIPQ